MSAHRVSGLITLICAGVGAGSVPYARAADAPPPVVVSTSNFIKAETQPWLTACEWPDPDGKFRSSWTEGPDRPADPVVPADALCTKVRRFNFAGGHNLLYATFQKDRPTPVQVGRLTNYMYVLSGHGRNMVDGQTMESGPGDIFAQMGNKPHQTTALSDDYVQLDVVGVPTLPPGEGLKVSEADLARGNLIHHKDAPKSEVCLYGLKDAVYQAAERTAASAAKIPAGSSCFTVYDLVARPGASVVEVWAKKGAKTLPHKESLDTVIYFVKGKVKSTIGDETEEMKAGDALLHPAGGLHADEFLEDTVQIEVKYPKLEKAQ